MNPLIFSRPQPRRVLARFFVVCLLFSCASTARAQGFEPSPPISNASELELQAVRNTLDALKEAALARDATALSFFGASLPADSAPLRLSERVSHLATSEGGALVRQEFTLSIERARPVVLASGSRDLWLSRAPDGTFAVSRAFPALPDALAEMQAELKRRETENRDAAGENDDPVSEDGLLDLVASRVGGRWISLRNQSWNGRLTDGETNKQTNGERDENGAQTPGAFLISRMKSAPKGRALTAHFVFERGDSGWNGIGAAFNEARRLPRAADSAATLLRERTASRAYALPESHRDFGIALSALGLFNEAADELQKAEFLQPDLIAPSTLKAAEANRARDPENVVKQQQKDEATIGYGADHPQYLIQALAREQQNTPSVLGALRLALEYSRLAEEDRAAAWGKQAQILTRAGVRPQDAGWVQLLAEHLRERQSLSRVKPTNILRSKLFTVRVFPGDGRAIPLLGALEEAQHTVYANFGIPMGNTEVILWRNQSEFARYTTKFSEQGGSEFVAALTLTKLVSTQDGPLVLGEEINTFSDARDLNAPSGDALFGTIAHEYGHVAVRQLSRGRIVPVWFNEGVATSVEGGYEGYIGRVRRAVNADSQLSMRELLNWNVDGERAFLAYSQANSIVDYMVKTWDKAAVLEVLRRIGHDTKPDAAFKSVLGVSQNELWERWLQNSFN